MLLNNVVIRFVIGELGEGVSSDISKSLDYNDAARSEAMSSGISISHRKH